MDGAGRATQIRDRERRQVLHLTQSAVTRPDRVVLLTGEAGIGKTHLAREVVSALENEGFGVAWGRADAVERAVPYSAIGQVLGALGGETVLSRGGSDVLQDVYRPVAELIENRCAQGPLVVTVDDLHFADEDTLVLLGFLVRRLTELPISWMFTSRTHLPDASPAFVQLLDRLRLDGRLDEVALEPLSAEEVGTIVDASLSRDLDASARDAIVDRASGNPFFAIQLALSASESEVPDRPVPSVSRRVVLLERVFPLGENARAVARVAAVCGVVDLDQLDLAAAAVGLEATDAEQGFDRLVRAGFLRMTPDGRYEFVHDLVRETLYEDLGPAERRRLHRAAADALLSRRALGQEVDLVELAHHLSSGTTGADERAALALRDAGDEIVARSPRSAAGQYRRALAFAPNGDANGELQVRLARALRRAGEPAEVVQVCRQGLLTAAGEDRDRLAGYLARALADVGEFHEAISIVDGELSTRGDAPVLLTTRAMLLRQVDDVDEAVRTLDRATAAARTVPERLAVLLQRLNLAIDLAAGATGQKPLVELEQLIPSLDPQRRLMAHAHAAGACVGFGELRRAEAHVAAADALEAAGVLDVDWPWTFAARTVLAVNMGRFDDGVRSYARGAPEFGLGLVQLVRNNAAVAVADVHFMRREPDPLRALVVEFAELNSQARFLKSMLAAKLDIAEGRLEEGIARYEATLATTTDQFQVGMYVAVALGQVCLRNRRPDRAAELVERLGAQDRAIGTVLSSVLFHWLEATLADDVDGLRGVLDSVLENGLFRYEPDARYELGRLGVDPEPNLMTAHRLWSTLGSVEDIAMTEAEMRRQGLRVPSRRQGDRYALTDAERRVAELVAQGMTNKAIAEQLAYSVKTIEAYLSRVYAKTGCSNRVELTRHLAAQTS